MTTKKKTSGAKTAAKPRTKPASRAGKAKAIPRPVAAKDPAPANTAAPYKGARSPKADI